MTDRRGLTHAEGSTQTSEGKRVFLAAKTGVPSKTSLRRRTPKTAVLGADVRRRPGPSSPQTPAGSAVQWDRCGRPQTPARAGCTTGPLVPTRLRQQGARSGRFAATPTRPPQRDLLQVRNLTEFRLQAAREQAAEQPPQQPGSNVEYVHERMSQHRSATAAHAAAVEAVTEAAASVTPRIWL